MTCVCVSRWARFSCLWRVTVKQTTGCGALKQNLYPRTSGSSCSHSSSGWWCWTTLPGTQVRVSALTQFLSYTPCFVLMEIMILQGICCQCHTCLNCTVASGTAKHCLLPHYDSYPLLFYSVFVFLLRSRE